jgi:hypothetical protein
MVLATKEIEKEEITKTLLVAKVEEIINNAVEVVTSVTEEELTISTNNTTLS